MRRGDVVWVVLPNTGAREQAGRRPAIVVEHDAERRSRPTVLVVPTTTNLSAVRFGHAAEQERARTVTPLKAAPLTATSIIDDWQRQG
jgi:mRNA-degrading endonuclease toxin of MazEF toxin-antitoxin module